MTNNHENRKLFFQDRIKDYHGEKNTATCQYSWVDGRLVHIDSLTDHKAVGHCILDNAAYPWVAVNSLGHYASGRSVEFADMRIAKQEWDIPKQQTYKEFLAAHDRDTLYEADDWLAWMRRASGACYSGRRQWVLDHGLDLDGKYTFGYVYQFCEDHGVLPDLFRDAKLHYQGGLISYRPSQS